MQKRIVDYIYGSAIEWIRHRFNRDAFLQIFSESRPKRIHIFVNLICIHTNSMIVKPYVMQKLISLICEPPKKSVLQSNIVYTYQLTICQSSFAAFFTFPLSEWSRPLLKYGSIQVFSRKTIFGFLSSTHSSGMQYSQLNTLHG